MEVEGWEVGDERDGGAEGWVGGEGWNGEREDQEGWKGIRKMEGTQYLYCCKG